jgi:hypothetical protein
MLREQERRRLIRQELDKQMQEKAERQKQVKEEDSVYHKL